MSGSFKKAAKAYQKVHRERPQPADRAHLGPLERKKDYVQRASDHHKKRDRLKVLRKKAAERNPDEFYFNMVSSEKVDGVHQAKNADVQDPEQEMLQRGRDIAYVSSKLNMERKKIEKLKATLSFLDPHFRTNRHTLFVDSEKEAPEALARLRQQNLEDGRTMMPTPEQQQELDKSYRLLAKRYEREKKLTVLMSKLEVAQHVQRDKKAKKKLVKEETKDSAAQYRWCYQRKR